MGLGAGLYMYDVVVKSSRSLSHLLMSFLLLQVEACTTIKTALLVREKMFSAAILVGWIGRRRCLFTIIVQGRNRCCKVGRKESKEGTPTQPTRVIYRNVKCRIRGNIPTMNIWKILTLDLSTLQQSGCQWFWTNTMLVSAAQNVTMMIVAALRSRCGHYTFARWFFLLSSSFFLFLA